MRETPHTSAVRHVQLSEAETAEGLALHVAAERAALAYQDWIRAAALAHDLEWDSPERKIAYQATTGRFISAPRTAGQG